MVGENTSLECRLIHIDETRNHSIEEINHHKLVSKKHKNLCATSNYIKHLLILSSAVRKCVSISAFASLDVILIGIGSSAVGSKKCEITAGI